MHLSSIFDQSFWRNHLTHATDAALSIAAVVIAFLVIRAVLYRVIDRVMLGISKREQGGAPASQMSRMRTLASLVKSVTFYVLVFISGVQVLSALGINTASVVTTAGIAGLAVGFGGQRLVRDVISGFIIVMENQYAVGDYVTIGAATGTVVELGIRITRLRDDVGRLVILANGDVSLVTNHSRGPIIAWVDLGLAPDADLERVRSAVDGMAQGFAERTEGATTPPSVSGVVGVEAAKVTVRVCCEVRAGRQEPVQRALREALRDAFTGADIKFA